MIHVPWLILFKLENRRLAATKGGVVPMESTRPASGGLLESIKKHDCSFFVNNYYWVDLEISVVTKANWVENKKFGN